MTVLGALARRWWHLLRYWPGHRAVTATRGWHGPVVLIACCCGEVFWLSDSLTEEEAREIALRQEEAL